MKKILLIIPYNDKIKIFNYTYFMFILLYLIFSSYSYSSNKNTLDAPSSNNKIIKPANSNGNEITTFAINGYSGIIIDHNIFINLPIFTLVHNLVASFKTNGQIVKVGSKEQISGTTANSFLFPVTYTVIAEDGSTANYRVAVTNGAINSTVVNTNTDGSSLALFAGNFMPSLPSSESTTPPTQQDTAHDWYEGPLPTISKGAKLISKGYYKYEKPANINTQKNVWVLDYLNETKGVFTSVPVTLKAVDPLINVEIWIDDSLNVSTEFINNLLCQVTNYIYPEINEWFGTLNTPQYGTKLQIILAKDMLRGGYQQPLDYFIDPYSNNGNFVYINGKYPYDVPSIVAHEFQHLISFQELYLKRDDSRKTFAPAWLNEAMSRVAEVLYAIRTPFGTNRANAYAVINSYINYVKNNFYSFTTSAPLNPGILIKSPVNYNIYSTATPFSYGYGMIFVEYLLEQSGFDNKFFKNYYQNASVYNTVSPPIDAMGLNDLVNILHNIYGSNYTQEQFFIFFQYALQFHWLSGPYRLSTFSLNGFSNATVPIYLQNYMQNIYLESGAGMPMNYNQKFDKAYSDVINLYGLYLLIP